MECLTKDRIIGIKKQETDKVGKRTLIIRFCQYVAMYLYSAAISQHKQQGRNAILLSCIWVKCWIIYVSLLHSSPSDNLSAISTATTVRL